MMSCPKGMVDWREEGCRSLALAQQKRKKPRLDSHFLMGLFGVLISARPAPPARALHLSLALQAILTAVAHDGRPVLNTRPPCRPIKSLRWPRTRTVASTTVPRSHPQPSPSSPRTARVPQARQARMGTQRRPQDQASTTYTRASDRPGGDKSAFVYVRERER